MISLPMTQDRQNPADSPLAERVWDAVHLARVGDGSVDVNELAEAARSSVIVQALFFAGP